MKTLTKRLQNIQIYLKYRIKELVAQKIINQAAPEILERDELYDQNV